ncbi:murein transglycosylase [Methylopila jiangsuensis]|uniref:Murein transglycosylase n=1 Tax=Methylopila jiangsuensis TaxID=586230 RepID=A0A9W6JFI8_9HYPH|nr:lytic murein transglycosylase [Methylopila jiangsuensis]MDR6287231.1 membrane-bound lytic murein transglycosylase B [Methylopila jiangsuensis]GLK74809.1 murein transglycosylase [Methylopila jiangsuensis]
MTVRRRTFWRTAAALLLASATAAPAMAGPNDARFSAFVRQLKPQAVAAGVSPALYDRAFRGLTVDEEAIAKSKYQPEFKTTIAQYVDTRVSDTRINAGRQNLAQWSDTLARIERAYGVDRSVVLAVWGIETNYGATTGNHNVIAALATLACCQTRRPEFFRRELIGALQILQQGHVAPENMNGSWAGAMGHTQFMPTSFKAYAADANGDGRRDIWGSIPDALASTANYLKKHGWRSGETWGYEVIVPRGTKAGARRTLAQWQAAGVRRVAGTGFPNGASPATLLQPGGPNGPSFLMLNNFRVIKRYNNADSYALAVGHLADRIRGGGPFVTPWPNHDKPLDETERLELQALLLRRGFNIGEPDGKIGPATRDAITSYQQAQGLAPDGYAGVSLLRHLRRAR